MIKFTKKELDFLSIYESCIDNKNPMYDKFQIKATKGSSVAVFSQFTDEISLITEVTKNIEEDFRVVFTTLEFNSLIKLIDADSEITVTSSGIQFNGNVYDLKNHDFDIGDTEIYSSIIKSPADETISFTQLGLFSSVKSYMGVDSGVDCIAYQNNYFVADDPSKFGGFVRTNNSSNIAFDFSKKLIQLIGNLKISDITFKLYRSNSFYTFNIGSTNVISVIKEYNLPNMFSEEIKEFYNHSDKVVVSKESFMKSLSRMKVVCSRGFDNRMVVTFEQDKIKLELNEKSVGYASESISATVDKDLIGFSFYASTTYLSNLISEFNGKEITIFSPSKSTEDPRLIKLEDEKADRFYILNIAVITN